MKAWWTIAAIAAAATVSAGCTTTIETARPVAATAPVTVTVSPNGQPVNGQALQQWRNRSAGPVASMQDAMRDLGIALKSTDYPAIRANCHKLGDAVDAIGSTLPSPDTRLTAAFDTAVHSFSDATGKCAIWAPGVTKQQVDAFMNSMHLAIDQMDTAMFMMGPTG